MVVFGHLMSAECMSEPNVPFYRLCL